MHRLTRGNRINYALLHSRGQKVPTNLAVPTPDKTMEKVLSLAEEASRLADDASRQVERILDLSDEDLEQALQEARDEAASLLRRKKAQELVEIRRQNANQRWSVEAAELPAASVKRQASTLKKQTQSLIGVLQFVAICVKPGRVFMARLLNFLRECPELGEAIIPEEVKADINWWVTFLPFYNGVSLIPERFWSNPDSIIACDACLTGAGGWCQGKYFHTAFPQRIQALGMHINGLEMLTLTVALKVWGKFLAGKKVTMLCDNLSSVVVVQTGRARDPFLQACLRELVFLQARWECQIRMQHIRGRTTDSLICCPDGIWTPSTVRNFVCVPRGRKFRRPMYTRVCLSFLTTGNEGQHVSALFMLLVNACFNIGLKFPHPVSFVCPFRLPLGRVKTWADLHSASCLRGEHQVRSYASLENLCQILLVFWLTNHPSLPRDYLPFCSIPISLIQSPTIHCELCGFRKTVAFPAGFRHDSV